MEPGVEPIRVLIADDHPVVRRGMGALLASLDGVEVVSEAADGAAAVREAQLTRPDVVVMDLQMPVLDGVEATRRLAAAVPDTAVLVLTSSRTTRRCSPRCAPAPGATCSRGRSRSRSWPRSGRWWPARW